MRNCIERRRPGVTAKAGDLIHTVVVSFTHSPEVAVVETAKIRINVIVPAQLVEEMGEFARPGERSSFIVQAIRQRIRTLRQQMAISAAAGAWSDEDHPELMTDAAFVNWHRAVNDDFARHAARM